ncbi:MAG: amino acid permease [Gemmatimonadetes bacterium]|nr:amino acid permease [Gemmatimonadota bacterium]NIO31929.1 amino acid permease [Gemmatimonadota bacterium]
MSCPGLKRILGVWDGLAVGVGLVIGVGILRTPGLIAGYLGGPWPILLAWVAGGVIALLSAMVFSEMAAMYPEAGGKFAYARQAFGPLGGFVAGWSEVIVTRGGFPAASKAIVIGEYLILLTGWGAIRGWAAAAVLAYFLLHLLGLQAGRVFQNIATTAKVVLILVIIGAGLIGGTGASWEPGATVTPERGLLLGFALAYLSISFTYYGWDDAIKMAEEIREPGRLLPRILVLGAIAVAVLYLAINVAFLSALSPAEMAGSPLVAADAVAVAFGESGRTLITVTALVILISSLNVNFLSVPRVVYGLARRGLAPAGLVRVSGGGTPLGGLFLITALVFLLAMTRSFEFLIQFMMFVAISVDAMVLIGLFKLRALHPDEPRPYRVPGYPWMPGVVVILYVMILVLVTVTQPMLAVGAGTLLAVLLAAGLIWSRARAQSV